MEPVRIPTRADEPPHLLLWSADEVVPIVGGLAFGIVVEQIMLCVLVGVVTTNLYKRFRDMHPDGFLMHLAYHYGFGFSKAKSMVNPFTKTFIP